MGYGDALNAEIGRRQFLGGLAVGGCALSLGAILEACGISQPTTTSTKLADKLTWALPGPVITLDPLYANITTNTAHALGYESLLEYDSGGKLVPQLATSWSQPDITTYVYKLREGVKFWDGSPLTADDVVFSLNRVRDPKNGSGWNTYYSAVDSIAATGANEVTIKLSSPDPTFKYIPGFGGSRIISRKFFESNAKAFGTTADATMGTGPYRYTGFTQGDAVTAVRNDSYWGPKPKFKTVVVRTIVDQSTRQLAMRSGEIDGAFTVPLDQSDQWKSIPGVSLQFAPELYVVMFAFDQSVSPWSDIHVRKAFSYSVDKAGLVTSILKGHGSVAPTIVPPQNWVGLLSPAEVKQLYDSLPQYGLDLKKAKAELAQSSVPNGFTTSLIYPDSVQNLGLAAQNLSENLKQIGITLNVNEVPVAQWKSRTAAHLEPLVVNFNSTVTTDPSELPVIFMSSRNAVRNGFNYANYKSSAMDSLLAQQRSLTDPSKRAAVLKEVIKLAADDVVYLPVYFDEIAMAVKSKYSLNGFSTWSRWEDWPDNVAPK
jgi:peptide/nickel transport system substrate-binding protein